MATILVVDDVSAHRAFLIELLRGDQHRLLEASNGSEALLSIEAERPDLVITDVLMPVMDGYEFVRRLRADGDTRSIPVLLYTAPYGVREARAFVRETSVPYVLAKPADPEEMLEIIARVLAGVSAPDERADDAASNGDFEEEYLRLLSDELADTSDELKIANARLRALVNIGLELATLRDSVRLIDRVCAAAYDLFGASYVTVGIVDPANLAIRRFTSCGLERPAWSHALETAPGVLGAAMTERRVLRGTNPGGDPVALQLPAWHPSVNAFLVAPISSPRSVYGWICLVGNDGQDFTAREEQLAKTLAGQVGRVYEIESEILDRRAAEAALRVEAARAQRYLDTADVVLLALDVDGRVTMINAKGCELTGWCESELLGSEWIDTAVSPDEREGARHRLSEALAGNLSSVRNVIRTRSGEKRSMEWRNITALRDDDGTIVGVFASGADVTERTDAVAALRTAEERMRFALDSAKVGIWDLDATSGELRWSEILEAQYGMQPGTFGGTFEDFGGRIHPEDREAVLGVIGRSMKDGGDFRLQHRLIRPDGEVRWVTGAGRALLDKEGKLLRAVGISIDITEQHELESQFQQSQKMEAVGRLAGGVAHDFNNLLTAILGYCDLLLGDSAPEDPRRADIEEIQKAGLSAAALTRQLLAFSRKEILVPALLDLNQVVSGMRPMLGRLIGEDVTIELELADSPAPVRADRGQLEQVVMNLALNSRDAMPTGGTLTLATGTDVLDEARAAARNRIAPGAYTSLTVTDTGSGIESDVLTRMFEPFFTTKESGKGTGLGLSTVHGIALQSGGTVCVETVVGRGTSIIVYLPAVVDESIGPVAERSSRDETAGTHTVLVVDDAHELRQLTRRLLERQGYKVLLAAGADEALRLFEQNAAIDILLTDVVMPGASGPELTRRLVEQRPGLKVIYMSGYTDDALVLHGAFEHGIAFLHKPFTWETLGEKIREVLGMQPDVEADASTLSGVGAGA